MFENPRRGRQARNFTKNVPKILDLKSSSEQIFSENWRWVPLLIVVTPHLGREVAHSYSDLSIVQIKGKDGSGLLLSSLQIIAYYGHKFIVEMHVEVIMILNPAWSLNYGCIICISTVCGWMST